MQNKMSRRASVAGLADTLRRARLQRGWSQRELSTRARMPQAQISRFETGGLDPQVSTFIELARSLDLEVQLVPRAAIAEVRAAVRSAEERSEERALRDLLAKLQEAADEAHRAAPGRQEIASIRMSLGELQPLVPRLRDRADKEELETLLRLLDHVAHDRPGPRGRHAQPVVAAGDRLRSLRNKLVHLPETERPAYSLDED